MRICFAGIAFFVSMAVFAAPGFGAQAEWKVFQTLDFEYEPVDMVVAAEKRLVYILNDHGEILIYAFNGRLKGTLNVGRDVYRIKAGPRDDMLFLLRKGSASIQSITISVTEDIEIQGSPFKGAANAPVTVAVFSDFQ